MSNHLKIIPCVATIAILMAVISSFNVAGQFSKAKLHPNCLKIEPTKYLSGEWGLRLFAGAHFYIPFGSSQAIHHISKLISAESKDVSENGSEDDAQKLCALVRIKGFRLEIEGHDGKFMIQDCSVIKKGTNECKVNRLSEHPEYQKNGRDIRNVLRDAIANIVWTDNETSMAIVRCTEDGLYNDWYVFSTLTSLNSTVKDTILSTISKLGFSQTLEDTISPSYEGCELFSAEELKDDD